MYLATQQLHSNLIKNLEQASSVFYVNRSLRECNVRFAENIVRVNKNVAGS